MGGTVTPLLNHAEVDALARELSNYTGETIAQAAIIALRERLAREQAKAQRGRRNSLKNRLLRIGRECAMLPIIDRRPADEILGYNAQGLPA
jgi:antitoxin VapB